MRLRHGSMCNVEVVMAGTTAQDLTSDEFSSLREVAKGLRQSIPEEHEKRLVERLWCKRRKIRYQDVIYYQ